MTQTQAAHTRTVDLLVGGMTCASCVGRVEKKLNRLEGVEASVNLATASARVAYDPALVDEDTLVATVERTGYTARCPASTTTPPPRTDDAGPRPAAPTGGRGAADGRRRWCWRWRPASPGSRGCSCC